MDTTPRLVGLYYPLMYSFNFLELFNTFITPGEGGCVVTPVNLPDKFRLYYKHHLRTFTVICDFNYEVITYELYQIKHTITEPLVSYLYELFYQVRHEIPWVRRMFNCLRKLPHSPRSLQEICKLKWYFNRKFAQDCIPMYGSGESVLRRYFTSVMDLIRSGDRCLSQQKYLDLFLKRDNFFSAVTIFSEQFNLHGIYSDQLVNMPHLMIVESILHPRHTWVKLFHYDYVCKIESHYVLVMDLHSRYRKKIVVMASHELHQKMREYMLFKKGVSEPEMHKSYHYQWENDLLENLLNRYMVKFNDLDGHPVEDNFQTPMSLIHQSADAYMRDYFVKKLNFHYEIKQCYIRDNNPGLSFKESISVLKPERMKFLITQDKQLDLLTDLNKKTSPGGEFKELTSHQVNAIKMLVLNIPILVYFYPFMISPERRFIVGLKALSQLRQL